MSQLALVNCLCFPLEFTDASSATESHSEVQGAGPRTSVSAEVPQVSSMFLNGDWGRGGCSAVLYRGAEQDEVPHPSCELLALFGEAPSTSIPLRIAHPALHRSASLPCTLMNCCHSVCVNLSLQTPQAHD